MTTVIPYLSVSNAIDALELYEKIFEVTDISRSPVNEDQASYFDVDEGTDLSRTTIHGEFNLEGNKIYISDNFSGDVIEKSNVSVLIESDDLERSRLYFSRAKDHDCQVTLEFEKQFWGDYFGSFIDPFGISWQINFTPQD